MIGTGVKTRYISGVVRDKEAGIKGLPSGTEEFMPLGLGETCIHTHAENKSELQHAHTQFALIPFLL